MGQKQGIISYIQNISLFLLGMFLMFFPLVFTTISTNPIILSKMTLLGIAVFVLLLLYAALTTIERSVKIRRTPFDVPVILFLVFVFLSAVFSVNRADALMGFVPFFFAGLIYFIIVNTAKDKNSLLFLMSTLITGAVLSSIFSLLTFFKIDILPISSTHTQNFSPLGSMLDQAIYLVFILTIAFYSTWRLVKSRLSEGKQELDFQPSKDTAKAFAFGA